MFCCSVLRKLIIWSDRQNSYGTPAAIGMNWRSGSNYGTEHGTEATSGTVTEGTMKGEKNDDTDGTKRENNGRGRNGTKL